MAVLLKSSAGLLAVDGSLLGRVGAGSGLPSSEITDDDKLGSGTDNVVLSLGSGGAWDDDYITAPCAVV